jgi:hypothetical protein
MNKNKIRPSSRRFATTWSGAHSRADFIATTMSSAKQVFWYRNRELWTIYSRPVTTDPTLYCQQLLGAIAKQSKSIVNTPNAGLLYQKLIALNPPDDEVQDIGFAE